MFAVGECGKCRHRQQFDIRRFHRDVQLVVIQERLKCGRCGTKLGFSNVQR